MPDPLEKPERPTMAETLRALGLPRRKPTGEDAVPATRVPMTKAQQIALELAKRKPKR